jgi:putative ABC transport system permease protein
MFRNYLLIAWRNLRKNIIFSGINILGLSIGMVACLLIVQYVRFEWSYDAFHGKADRIYRIEFDRYRNGQIENQSAWSSPGVAPAAKMEIPEVENFARLWSGAEEGIVTRGGKTHHLNKIFFADASVFSIFSYRLLQGDPATALDNRHSVVLSQSTARKLFGDENPLGKIVKLTYMGSHAHMVTGVMEDLPENTHLKPNMLVSFSSLIRKEEDGPREWNWNGFYTYLLLRSDASPAQVEGKFPALINKYKTEEGTQWKFSLQPLRSIHLHSHLMHEIETNGYAALVYALMVTAVLILVLAWMNYVNFSTAKAAERAREVGIRKAIGANQAQLIRQFLTESLLVNGLAMGAAFTLYQILLPFYYQFTGHSGLAQIPPENAIWFFFGAFLLIGTFVSGAWPAFFLAAIQPVPVLKGRLAANLTQQSFRKALVVFQFSVSVILLTGTLAVYRQVGYMRQQYLGMNMNGVLVIKTPRMPADTLFRLRFQTFKKKTDQLAAVGQVASVSSIPGVDIGFGTSDVKVVNRDAQAGNTYSFVEVDPHFMEVLQLRLAAGRPFNKNLTTDNETIMLNEAAARQLGFTRPEEALGQMVHTDDFDWTRKVVGVIKNYHQESLKKTYRPIIYLYNPQHIHDYIVVKLNGSDISKAISSVQSSYNQVFPGIPFNYSFLDQQFNQQYRADQQFGRVFGLFAGLAVFVACLGLFGLSLFATSQRTKEIGVRKVMGASVSSLLLLLSKDFIRLVVLAALISVPIAALAVRHWLREYAFRIDLSLWFFILPALLVLIIALLTVSIQTLRAARLNPVDSLRYE